MKIKSFIAVISVLLIGGCASPWEKSYEPNDALAGQTFDRTTTVDVRTIPFERYQRYVQAERQERIASSTAPVDLSEQDKLAATQRLLDTLQVKAPAREVVVLGFSEFTSNEQLSPHDERLRKFARKIGADTVVIASTYTGQVTRIQDRPVTTHSQGFTTFTRGRGRRGQAVTYSDQTTTWVPVQVTEDQFFYEAVFLRSRQ